MWGVLLYAAAAWAGVTVLLWLALLGVMLAERAGFLHPQAAAPSEAELLARVMKEEPQILRPKVSS